MVCKISQPKRGLYENGPWLRNNLTAPRSPLRNQALAAKPPLGCEMISQPHAPPLRKFSQLRNTPLAHECHFAAFNPISQLRNALRNPQNLKTPIFTATPPFRKWFRSCETTPWHTSAILQLRNGLRKCPSAAKSTLCCEIDHLLRK